MSLAPVSAFSAGSLQSLARVRSPSTSSAADMGGTPPAAGTKNRPLRAKSLAAIQLMLLLAKQGFQEVAAGDVPSEVKKNLLGSAPTSVAVTFYQHPGTGEYRALVEKKGDPQSVSLVGATGGRNSASWWA